MAGKIKDAIDQIIGKRAGGNATLISTTRTKLLLKGIDIDKYAVSSPDDPAVLQKVEEVAKQLGIEIIIK